MYITIVHMLTTLLFRHPVLLHPPAEELPRDRAPHVHHRLPGVDSEALLDADSDVVLDVVLDVLEVLGVVLDADVVLDALSAVDPDSNCDRVAPSALPLKLFSCEMPRVLAML